MRFNRFSASRLEMASNSSRLEMVGTAIGLDFSSNRFPISHKHAHNISRIVLMDAAVKITERRRVYICPTDVRCFFHLLGCVSSETLS